VRAKSVRGAWLVGLVCWAAVAGGCATASSFRPPTVGFRIESNAPDATVWVDDRLVGRVSDFAKPGNRIPVGFHRIELRHPACYAFFLEIEPKRNEDVVVRAPLHELLP